MRKCGLSIEDVKRHVAELKGSTLTLSVNKGRKRITDFGGEVVDTFRSVFTFMANDGELMSFAYADVICGNIVITVS